MQQHYYYPFAAAYVRGKLSPGVLPARLATQPLSELDESQLAELVSIGEQKDLHLQHFSRQGYSDYDHRLHALINGLKPRNLLDIGSGRGTRLWPLLMEFPELKVTAIDSSARHAAELNAVHSGGIKRLSARRMNITAMEYKRDTFDIVMVLELLEHISHLAAAIGETVRVARKHIIVSVRTATPAQNGDQQGLEPDIIAQWYQKAGASAISWQELAEHRLGLITLGER